MTEYYLVRSKAGCPHCVIAKEALASRGIAYVEEIYDDLEERQAMYDLLELEGLERTVPQVTLVKDYGKIRMNQHIGGAKALVDHLEEMEAFA